MSTQPGTHNSSTRPPDCLACWLQGDLRAVYDLSNPTNVASRVLDLLEQLDIIPQGTFSPEARAILAYDLSTAEGQDFLVEYLGDLEDNDLVIWEVMSREKLAEFCSAAKFVEFG